MWVDHANAVQKPAPWDNGTVGVDIFFVISGFVMMMSSKGLQDRNHPAKTFLWRRLIRIAPLYWLLTSIKLILIEARPTLASHPLPSHWNIIASYIFLPSYGATGEIRPVLPVGWTLNFEMFFYLIFAIALAARIRVLYLILPVMGLLSVAAFFRTPVGPALAVFEDPIVLDFVAGMLIAVFLKKIQSISVKIAGAAAAIALLEIMLYVPHTSISIIRILTYGCGASSLVVTTVVFEPYLANTLPKWVLSLGDASYSIYLMQSFALAAAGHFLLRLGVFGASIPSGFAEWLCILCGVSASILCALPVYYFVELPLTRYLKTIKLLNN